MTLPYLIFVLITTNSLLYELFRQDFYRYYSSLCQYAFRLIKESHTCEDMVQDIFLHIWQKKQQLIGSNELKPYLYTAVRNKCLTHIKKRKKSPVIAFSGEEVNSEPPEETTTKENKEKDINALIKEALEQLPPKCRGVFVLSRIDKLSYQQIADKLGISVKTVENQIGKALKVLREFAKKNRPVILLFLIWMIK